MIEVTAAGDFNLTKFTSNSLDMLDSLPDDKNGRSTNHLEIHKEQVQWTPGISWRAIDGYFTFTRNIKCNTMTKRGMLSTVSSNFDPLGFLALLTLKLNTVVQEIRMGWRDASRTSKVWKRWLQGISRIKGFELKRWYHQQGWQCSNIQLHLFCDPSEAAYKAVG